VAAVSSERSDWPRRFDFANRLVYFVAFDEIGGLETQQLIAKRRKTLKRGEIGIDVTVKIVLSQADREWFADH